MAKALNRKPTSFDVAELAGVSRSAVSRAFTPGAHISTETRKKVERAASELGYRVNSLARGLQQKHSGIVGIVCSRLDTPLRSRQVRLLSEALIRQNLKPMLITAETPDDLARLIESLLGYSVAGVIVTDGSPPRALIEECRVFGLPVVMVNRAGASNWGDRVIANNEESGALAVDVLVKCGATRLGCLMPRNRTYSVSGRADAFVAEAKARNLLCVEILATDQTYDDSRSSIARFGRADLKSIDGLFCATDLMAIGALDGLRTDLGLNVPKDIQVLGFDDIEQAAWVTYNLSTIRQNIEAQVEAVVRLLSDRLLDSSLPIRVHNQELTPVLRGTTRHDS
jgi:DNA-binding LacI/PurR family transcriptional regulator